MLGGLLQHTFLPHIPEVENSVLRHDFPEYNELLPLELGLVLSARVAKVDARQRTWMNLELYRDEQFVGDAFASVRDGVITPHIELDESLRGKRLGVLLYEILYAHAYRYLDARLVQGCGSEDAFRLHQSLARRHGWQLKDKGLTTDAEGDVFHCYEYALTVRGGV